MADILLNKVINDEIVVDSFTKWLLQSSFEHEEDMENILACNVTQIDFITYFINFIHEEVPCNNKFMETPQKINTPKRLEKISICSSKEPNRSINSNLFTNEFSKTPNGKDCPNSVLDISVGKFSTPKVTKTPLNKNSSYFSPVSPLYQNHNSFSSKESKNDNSARKIADKHSLCLGDFIVTASKSSSKKKRVSIELHDDKKETSRRIKPTSICTKPIDTDFQKTENSFNFQENLKEVSVKSAIEQRNLLVEERIKILSRKDSLEKNSYTLLTKRRNSLSKSDISPSFVEVTFKCHLDYVATIYTTILKHQMVLNITSEIYFLISLLLSKQPECFRPGSRASGQDNTSGDSNLGVEYLDQFRDTPECVKDSEVPNKSRLYNSEVFESIHNVVYFAVRCLEAQTEIIKLYDRTTLRLLADNERIRSFSRVFSKKLSLYAEKKSEKPVIEIGTPNFQSNVCFNIDTDNKENFPDQTSFHAFRKQRDLFYEILRIWEIYHLSSDWIFSVRLGGKIRTLFSLNCEPTNYMHLARLFKNQLLSNCAKGPKEQGLSENNLSFLPSVEIDADKLNRLTNRLVTKQTSNGINSLPSFNGYQEFYRDFIIAASNHFFNKHLGDTLISEIVELNDTKFNGIDMEEGGHEIDSNTRKRYVSCIKNLRILAKFLGFMDSLPYKSEFPNLSKNVLESQIKTRSQYSPSLDIKLLLIKSMEKNTMVLLIPWVTKYIAMLDYVTVRLPYYSSVNKILFDIYRNLEDCEKNTYNIAIVKFCLGWLFELPHFPDSQYFNFCSKVINTTGNMDHKNLLKVVNGDIKSTKTKLKEIDQLNIVNQSVLYLCCPYLEEIKKLLATNASSSGVSAKYITPVTAVESNSAMARKKLEQQLEDAFFSSQPASLRKTIEFVSERIASTAVKYICHDLVPKAKEMAVNDLKENLLNNSVDDAQKKIIIKKQATALAHSHLSTFLDTCDSEIRKISKQKIPPSLDGLLPIDTLEETKNICVDITTKMYTERVKQWVNSHVNLSVFLKDFDSEVQKALSGRKGDKDKVPFILPSGGRNCEHNEDSLSGFHLLNNIREACCELIETNEIKEENIINLLKETYKSLTKRNDINDMITMNICQTLFDLCLLSVLNSPSLYSKNDDLISHFTEVWSLQQKKNNFFKALFCPKNIKILQRSTNSHEAWNAYAKIIHYLMEKKLIELENLESQCTGFYNRDWDQDTLENFSNFLKKFVIYSKCDTSDSSFAYLLDFLSDFCSDL